MGEFKGVTLCYYECPNCFKRRMLRPLDHKVSDFKMKKELPDGSTIEHLVDVCDACLRRISKKYYKTDDKRDAQKVLDALKELNVEALGDKSLEDIV